MKPNHSYYQGHMLNKIVQVTNKQRTAKQMASATVGIITQIAMIAFCLWCVS